MATRFGVRRYPVVFVDDVLFARPKDFGFGGPEDVGGAYVPWLDPGNQRRFKADLHAAVARRLSGATIAGHDIADVTTASDAFGDVAAVPKMLIYDAAGRRSKVLFGAPPDLHQQIDAAIK